MALVRNGLLAAGAPRTKQHRATRRRSTSVTPLDRSDLSRVTLVEEDPELTADDSSKSNDSYEIISYDLPKHTWVDHVRGVFCMSPSKKRTIMRKESSRAKPPVGPVVCRPSSSAFFTRSHADIYCSISSFKSLTRTHRMT
jgi:hypothetical protein